MRDRARGRRDEAGPGTRQGSLHIFHPGGPLNGRLRHGGNANLRKTERIAAGCVAARSCDGSAYVDALAVVPSVNECKCESMFPPKVCVSF